MSGDVFASIREDIQIIHNTIKNQLLIKAGHVGDYAHLEFSPMDNFIRPAVVLIAARLYNCRSAKVISLGAIVQFIFMASHIHKNIPETAIQSYKVDPRDGTQFPVLVGDYLYGKFFTTLCDSDLLQYLRPLAEMIGRIHEGGILYRKNLHMLEDNNKLVNEIVRLEIAELMAGAARLAGDLAGAPEGDRESLYEFGVNLGMVYGLLQRNPLSVQGLKYTDQALKALEKLPNRPEKAMLENLVRALCLTEEDIRKVV
ncbi:polyprenyl synthetase family protein [Desulforamulus putei]|uniref:Polyprenyl synthetase n=1 Tax=Desulforamulus putei DSM 12395 TaxID=1121429 RepID=A0A1M4WVD7_9FIRM|nr:polyprenyl synthetase family protein [Desulforamulus putei]SHE85127.1 Polyprenyl synthetase [Desulforamulus putei DSM 12395]